jgi:hypothetical protein
MLAHELLHAAGFWHEQSRPDRDQYIKVDLDNVDKPNHNQFEIQLNQQTFGLQYDYESVMQYGSYTFSKNGKPTMLAKLLKDPIIKNAHEKPDDKILSDLDLQIIKKLYKC